MQKHTLKAVFSMPNELFVNSKVGVVTAVLILEAHIPHFDKKDVFFGYYKDDGFTKRKPKGRLDYNEKWKGIADEWLDLYINSRVKAGLSVMQKVTPSDEWCAEAYMETDYTTLTDDDFIKKIKDYVAFQFLNSERGV